MNDDAGLVRPFRRRVRHAACGTLTVISAQAAEALALDPRALPDLHCTSCQRQFPAADFWWIGDDGNEAEPVGWIPPPEPEAEDDVQPAAEPEQPAAVAVALADYDELAEDAADRRAALSAAVTLLGQIELIRRAELVTLADHAYRWLRSRDTLRATSIQLIPGKPFTEGTISMTATINLDDTAVLPFSLGGEDAKGVEVGAPADNWAWTLNDPDASGAVLTVSADTLSATVAAGTPTSNLNLSVAGANTGLTGAEAIVVLATAATTISLVAGTPAAESDGSATPSA